LGDVKTGEGVFGLRRAFQLAGVRTVILSLWPVDDDATREWMASLYRARFLNHRDAAQSARQASLAMLTARRANHLASHPFYWAAFVANGDWR
jgi:CHAT domain-containing protein